MRTILLLVVIGVAVGCGGDDDGANCVTVDRYANPICEFLNAEPIEYCHCWSGGDESFNADDFPGICFVDPNRWVVGYKVPLSEIRGATAALVRDAADRCGMEAHAVVRPFLPSDIDAGDAGYHVSAMCGAQELEVVAGYCVVNGEVY